MPLHRVKFIETATYHIDIEADSAAEAEAMLEAGDWDFRKTVLYGVSEREVERIYLASDDGPLVLVAGKLVPDTLFARNAAALAALQEGTPDAP